MNAVLIDKPKHHDIEAVRPHLRKHLRPFKFVGAGGAEITINGMNHGDAKKRLSKMTGNEVAFISYSSFSKKVKH